MEAQYWIPTVTNNGRHLDVYSSMLADGIIFVNAPIDQRIAGIITSCLLHISSNAEEPSQPQIYLNTKRGDIVSALSVVDIIEFYKRKGVTIQTIGFGELGAAAALILAAGTGGMRRAAAHCHISLHFGTGNVDFAISSDQAKARQSAKTQSAVVELLSKYSGQERDLFRTYTNSESYLDAPEARQFGLVDEVI